MKPNASNPLSQSNLAKGHIQVVLMQRENVSVFSPRNPSHSDGYLFLSFFCASFFATHQPRKIIPGWVLISAVSFFSHCPSSDQDGKREATFINGILSLLLPRSSHQIWASGLSAEELRAADVQATDRCDTSLVSAMRTLGSTSTRPALPRVTGRLQHLFSPTMQQIVLVSCCGVAVAATSIDCIGLMHALSCPPDTPSAVSSQF